MKAQLLIDFGSTNTKLTLVDLENESIAATAMAHTTVETDVIHGYHEALKLLMAQVPDAEIIGKKACSSAAGGLKMVAIGLAQALTTEAAKRAALGAGARVLASFHGDLREDQVQELLALRPDVILLAGGTDGGNQTCILHNAALLAPYLRTQSPKPGADKEIPLLVAGNAQTKPLLEEILAGVPYTFAENVMPKVNVLNVQDCRTKIQNIFIHHITKAPGMTDIQAEVSDIIMPTPAAVLQAARLLAEGTPNEPGIGDLILVDIGGATTDVHSLSEGLPTNDAFLTGLEEPYAKRTVEGDLGMRYSIASLFANIPSPLYDALFSSWSKDEIQAWIDHRKDHTEYVPLASELQEQAFDQGVAKVCAALALSRHTGRQRRIYGMPCFSFNQEGKDLRAVPTLLGTGGILVYSDHGKEILQEALTLTEPKALTPKAPRILLDRYYILSAMGLLAESDPDLALRILKKELDK